MRVVMIGGSGHVGTYLVPRLVEAGHEVINLTRGQSKPYLPHAAWNQVQQITIDRDAEDAAGTFGQRVRDLKADIVIDMICFTLESAKQITDALRGQVQHFLHCGTVWIYGYNTQTPATEEQPRKVFGRYNFQTRKVEPDPPTAYGVQKAAIEAYLLNEARRNGFPATMLHPGHIVGPGHNPLNPQGNFNPKVFEIVAQGEELILPNLGLETVHHVHADDVAQAFMAAIANRSTSLGENFHVVSSAAVTLRGYAEIVASWFGREANIRYVSWGDYVKTVSEADAGSTWDHIAHSPNASIAKAERLLNYRPRYTSFQAVYEALSWLIEHGEVDAPPLGH
jgi:nucleoside-diphosphate-sugar epimerase